jgi:hypothetical protein
MTESELEAAALQLPPRERARLAERLLTSLDSLTPKERDEMWSAEALRRDAELDVSPELARENGDVFAEAKTRVGG